jgi:hypothetical protein
MSSNPIAQVGETLRQLHSRLVEFVGSSGKAQAIEAGAAILVILLVLIYLRGHYSSHARRRRSSRKRFAQLARANRLNAGDRQLLLAMARHLELEEPGLLFVRRSYFETAAEQGGFKPERVEVLRREIYS